MWRYSRGIAFAAQRNFAAARAEADEISALERATDFSLLKASGVPGEEVMRLARTVIEGRVAQAQGDLTESIARFEEASAIQDALPYTEPPYWYYPVRQTLAATLLQAGRLTEAEDQFQRALERAPANGWSYYGLLQVYKSRGDAAAAARTEAELARTWLGDRQLLQISNL
jgi:tetratricopeptide (TPR) repeat protein